MHSLFIEDWLLWGFSKNNIKKSVTHMPLAEVVEVRSGAEDTHHLMKSCLFGIHLIVIITAELINHHHSS